MSNEGKKLADIAQDNGMSEIDFLTAVAKIATIAGVLMLEQTKTDHEIVHKLQLKNGDNYALVVVKGLADDEENGG